MLADEPTVRPGLFRLPDDPVAETVLIPGFRSATSVRGAFGWFTAGWIVRLAPGLAEYLNRPDAAAIRFTVAPAIFPREREAIERGASMSADEAAELVARVFTCDRAEATTLGRHALNCLAWMIAAGRLRLRIAVPTPTSNYHPKIWLFDDGRDRVLARGSGNATAHGVAAGVEHLDVDVSWVAESERRVTEGVAILNDWTNGRSLGIARVVDLPEALAEKIIRTAPDSPPEPQDYAVAAGREARLLRRARRAYTQAAARLRIPPELQWRSGTYAHQGEAVAAWEGGDDPERGIVAMATGAGKTLTALVCAARAQDRLDGRAFLVVASAPSIPLIQQWRDQARKFGIRAVAPALEAARKDPLTRLLRALRGGGTQVVVVTNNMLCSLSFQTTLAQAIARPHGEPIATMLIGDEAHTLGAESFLANQPTFFTRRLGDRKSVV